MWVKATSSRGVAGLGELVADAVLAAPARPGSASRPSPPFPRRARSASAAGRPGGRSGTRSRRRRSRRRRSRPPTRAPAPAGRARPWCSRRRAAGRRRRSRAGCSRPGCSPCRGCGRPPRCGALVSNSSITPAAASSTPSPSGSATWRLTSWRARSMSSWTWPPRKYSGLRRPSTRLRSVIEAVSHPALGPGGADHRARRESGPISGRPRVGVDADEGAAAGADRVDLDQRHVEQEFRHVRGRGDLVALAGEQGDVEGGAADVGAEHVVEADPVGQPAGADDAADRARDQRRRQLVGVDRDRAAVARPSPAARSRRRAPWCGRGPRAGCRGEGSAA